MPFFCIKNFMMLILRLYKNIQVDIGEDEFMTKDTVYIALKDKICIDIDRTLKINDLGHIFCNNKSIERVIGNLIIYRAANKENWDYLDSKYIIEKAIGYNPNVDINMIGAKEVLIEIKSIEYNSKYWRLIKITVIIIILFLGSAIAIVNFHEDVNMTKSIEKIYYTFTGKNSKKPKIMTIPYSIGMGVGIIAFFNRVISSSERRKKEPGPMEIESYLYDKDMNDYLIQEMKTNNRDYEG